MDFQKRAGESKAFHKNFAEKVIEAIKNGNAPFQREKNVGNRSPFNPVSGTVYRGVNRLHLSMEGLPDPRFMTLKQANSIGYRVIQGSKSRPVVFWQFTEMQPVEDEDGNKVLTKDGVPEMQQVELERPILHIAHVFNVSQIISVTGEPFPPFEEEFNANSEPLFQVESILHNSGAKFIHDTDESYYDWDTDEIHIPDKYKFDDINNYYATALHELAHWTGNQKRLGRYENPDCGNNSYAQEELVAEIASWMMSQDYGFGIGISNHDEYVDAWIKKLDDDPFAIARACRDAEKIKNMFQYFANRPEKDAEDDMNTYFEDEWSPTM
jgi:antirestriction protein ArdC